MTEAMRGQERDRSKDNDRCEVNLLTSESYFLLFKASFRPVVCLFRRCKWPLLERGEGMAVGASLL